MTSPLKAFEKARPFTKDEAWLLFRLAAFGEAIGWTILITGILLKRYVFHGNDLPVLIAGQFHGTIFLVYLVAAIGLYPSLRWPRLQACGAILASIPPYGSLLFEQWEAHRRRKNSIDMQVTLLAYQRLCRVTV